MSSNNLPTGQRERSDFPRFGLSQYANRFPKDASNKQLVLSGDVLEPMTLSEPFARLMRVEQISDFHCVTTWSRRNICWGGVHFAEFYRLQVAPKLKTGCVVNTVVVRGQDGYRTTMLLSDLLADDVLLVDTLDGTPLTVEHGAPIRLVAPAHYGYKSVKHVSQLEFWQGAPKVKPAAFAFMDHPRARVAFEERGRWLPAWLLRLSYRPLVQFTADKFSKAMKRQ